MTKLVDAVTLSRKGIEVWRPVLGYVGLYEISNLGRVKSVARVVKTKHWTQKWKTVPEKILNPVVHETSGLTLQNIMDIREGLRLGVRSKDLAAQYKVDPSI